MSVMPSFDIEGGPLLALAGGLFVAPLLTVIHQFQAHPQAGMVFRIMLMCRCRCGRVARHRATKFGGLASLFSVSAVLLLLAGGYLWLLGGTSPHASGSIGGPWTLTRADGKVVSDRDFRGRFLLIYFGYTSCPDICPTTLGVIEDVMQQLGSKASRLQPVFITVDPQRDTPAVVERYLSSFGPNLIGLTGTKAQILAVQRVYRIRSVVHGISPAENDNIDHTAVLLLIGPDGRYLLPLTLDTTPAEITARLTPYLSS